MSEKSALENNGHHNVYVDPMQTIEKKTVVYKIQDSSDSVSSSDNSSRGSSGGCNNCTLCLWLMVAVSVILAIAALAFAGAIVYIDQKALSASQEEVEALMREIDGLEALLNKSHVDTQMKTIEQSVTLQARIDELSNTQSTFENDIEVRMEDFNSTIATQHAQLNSEIDQVHSDLTYQLEGNIVEMNHQLDNVQDNIDFAQGQLNGIHSNVSELNGLIESEVAIYDDCITDYELCTIERVSESSRFYRRICGTPWADVNVTGYYTVDTHCTYQSNYGSGHLVTSVLHSDPGRGRMRCRCSVSRPSHTSDRYQTIQTNLDSTCTLEIVRCPISQALY